MLYFCKLIFLTRLRMHDFFKMMRQYASPYKGYLAGAVVLNML